MHGIHPYMGWTHIPDMDYAASSADDNSFAAPKQQPAGKISVNLPTDSWLCHKKDILLRYNSLPCGTECCLRQLQGMRPTSKKNKCLVLTEFPVL